MTGGMGCRRTCVCPHFRCGVALYQVDLNFTLSVPVMHPARREHVSTGHTKQGRVGVFPSLHHLCQSQESRHQEDPGSGRVRYFVWPPGSLMLSFLVSGYWAVERILDKVNTKEGGRSYQRLNTVVEVLSLRPGWRIEALRPASAWIFLRDFLTFSPNKIIL